MRGPTGVASKRPLDGFELPTHDERVVARALDSGLAPSVNVNPAVLHVDTSAVQVATAL